ncbi:MAG: general secretion pathway protein GspK [Deltaproteobacteria bacterium]|nr:general secretion pathway protein GspK [Deltaproteobacteria bacterium]
MSERRRGIFTQQEKGTVLIVTMWIVLVLVGIVLVLSRSMRVETIAAANHVSSLQADAIAKGALHFIRARLNNQDEALMIDGDTPYEAIPVGDGYFWLLRPDFEIENDYSFGIRDECTRINLNTAIYNMLMNIPGMTSEFAASIIDWRDRNSSVDSAGGAEDQYYLLLTEPHLCKNADFETVEELLMVKGATPELLYGEDLNRNGVLDPNENDGDESDPQDNQDGNLDRGIIDYVTVYSIGAVAGGRTQGSGPENAETVQPGLININTAPGEILLCVPILTEDQVEEIIELREAGASEALLAFLETLGPYEEYFTFSSYRYSTDICSVSGDGRAFKRYQAVFDTQVEDMPVIYWKDLTHLGWPLDPEIITTLRSGESLEE